MSGRKVVATAMALAEAGVDYTSRHGALCPYCGKRAKVRTTRPWDGPARVRYHVCANPRCLLCQYGKPIKSIETEAVSAN